MVTARRLRAAPVSACLGYHAIGDPVIRRVAVTSVTAPSRAVLMCSGEYTSRLWSGCSAVLGAMQIVKVQI